MSIYINGNKIIELFGNIKLPNKNSQKEEIIKFCKNIFHKSVVIKYLKGKIEVQEYFEITGYLIKDDEVFLQGA